MLMMARRVPFAGVSVVLHEDWSEIDDEGLPPTLARDDGVGALLFTVALHESGPRPRIDRAQLWAWLEEFAAQRELGALEDRAEGEADGHQWVRAACREPDAHHLVWFVSDGAHTAFATFSAVGEEASLEEQQEAAAIVESTRFPGA